MLQVYTRIPVRIVRVCNRVNVISQATIKSMNSARNSSDTFSENPDNFDGKTVKRNLHFKKA